MTADPVGGLPLGETVRRIGPEATARLIRSLRALPDKCPEADPPQEGPEPPWVFDSPAYRARIAELMAYHRAVSDASSLAAGEGPDVTQPAPPEGTPDYPGDPWQAPSRGQWIGALGAILAGMTVVFAVIGFCDVLRMMFGQ